MAVKKGTLSIDSENIFPIIKKWVYSDHDIFVRELVSNGCDAVTKLKKLDMMGEYELPEDYKAKIEVIVNPEEKTMKFIDNGLGMTAEEVEEYITQIAFSGATQFLEKYKDKTTEDDMIGHFGLGFYSAFMVADEVQIADVEKVLERQVKYNTKIAEEGLKNPWGAQVGRVVLEEFGNDVKWRAVAKAAAGSDARMSGCALPVIINSGSGNQGMTCSLPVIEFGKELEKSKEEIYRALCVSNLVALNQKKYIGSLSAYCGAVCAAAGAGAGITYLCGGTLEQIENTVVNTIADAGGIVCDGAKPSCAAKISTALQAAVLSHKMAMRGLTFAKGEGLVMDCPEDTIKAVGYVGRAGMKQTDVEILNLMIGKTKLEDIDK